MTYRIEIVCEQTGEVALKRDGVPKEVADYLIDQAPEMDKHIARIKAVKSPLRTLASMLAAKLSKTD